MLPDLESVAEAAAREFSEACREATGSRGVFRVALSGGSTPRALYARLASAPHREEIAWDRVRFFWGDERCVPPDSERSNYRMAKETLLDPLRIPARHVFRMRGEDEPARSAAAYEELLATEFERDPPRFDLVLLGMGADGHTASLFQRSRALTVRRRSVTENYVRALREWRLTLTLRALNAARRVLFLVAGADKRPAAERVLARKRGWRALPAAGVRPAGGSLLWLLDEEAGGGL